MQIARDEDTQAERLLAGLEEADAAMKKLGWDAGPRLASKPRAGVHDRARVLAAHMLNAQVIRNEA